MKEDPNIGIGAAQPVAHAGDIARDAQNPVRAKAAQIGPDQNFGFHLRPVRRQTRRFKDRRGHGLQFGSRDSDSFLQSVSSVFQPISLAD